MSPDFREFVSSIKKDGILQPILVRPVGDRYEVVEGNHRYTAAKELRFESIPCLVRDLTNKEVDIIQLKANALRPQTLKCEYAARLTKLIRDNGLTIREVCAIVDKSPTWVKSQLSLTHLVPEIQVLVDSGAMKAQLAHFLAKMPHTLQEECYKQALDFNTTKEAIHYLRGIYNSYREALIAGKFIRKSRGIIDPYFRTMPEVVHEHETQEVAGLLLHMQDAKTPLDGWKLAIEWVLHIDKETRDRVSKAVRGNSRAFRFESKEAQNRFFNTLIEE